MIALNYAECRRRSGSLPRRAAAVILLLGAGCTAETQAKVPPSAQLLLDAKAALASGDNARALEALNASIDAQPTVWALVERARLNAKLGSDQAARDDCRQLRSLDPENRDAAWLEGELKKPAADRFEGKFADPPSARK